MPDFKKRYSIQRLLAFQFILVCFTSSGWIFTDPVAAEEAVSLAPIIVTARSGDDSYQTGDVNTSVSPVFYHKINRSEFEGKIEDLSEVIKKQAGVQVRQTGGLGSFSSDALQ